MQLELDLGLDPITSMMIDIESIKQKQEALRRSFFARLSDLEKRYEESIQTIESLKREITSIKMIQGI